MLENRAPAPGGSIQAIQVTVGLPKTRPGLTWATRDEAIIKDHQGWLTRPPASEQRPACKRRHERQATVTQDTGRARPDSESGNPRQGLASRARPGRGRPRRRRLGRLESGAGESAAAVTRLLDKARADSDNLLLYIMDYSRERSRSLWVALLLHLRSLLESALSSPGSACHLSLPPVSECSILGRGHSLVVMLARASLSVPRHRLARPGRARRCQVD